MTDIHYLMDARAGWGISAAASSSAGLASGAGHRRDACATVSSGGRVRSGFTFLEIMVVVVILGTLMALVLPTLSGVAEGVRLRSSVRGIANLMKIARTEAVLGSRTTEVRLNLAENTYRLDLREPDNETRAQRLTSSRIRNKRRNIEQDRALDTRVRFDEVEAAGPQILNDKEVVVRFFPDGSSTKTRITLINNKGRRSTLEVIRATGLVETRPGGGAADDGRLDNDGAEGERE